MRSAAEGEHRTGEDVGEAVPLMPLEAIQPFGKGEVKGNARRACPRSQSGKNRRGLQAEGACPSEARRVARLVTDPRDRGRSVVTKKKPRRSGVEGVE